MTKPEVLSVKLSCIYMYLEKYEDGKSVYGCTSIHTSSLHACIYK